jgi:hypothetical protein
MRRLPLTFVLDVVLVSSLTAQSALFTLPGSTRAAGLGGAGAALVGDAGAVFANPAAIATVRRLALEASYQQYLGRTAFGTGALALRVGRFDWGLGAQALGDASSATDLLGMSSLVFRSSVIALGASAKYARQWLGPAPAHAWAGDAGLAIAVFDIMALGVSVQNIGGELGGGVHLPRRTRAGFTMNYVDPQGAYRLLTTVEGQWPDVGSAFVVLGLETGIVRHGVGVLGRTGYVGHSVATAASPFTFGGTVELGRLHVDYAYRAHGAGGADTHRLGARWTP